MKKGLLKWQPGMRIENSAGTINPNTLGYQYTIQTTTQILPEKVIGQTFYTVPFEKFVPVEVGLAAWMEQIKINTGFRLAGNFFQGLSSLSQGNAQMARVDVGLAPVTVAIDTFTGGYDYTIAEINKALASDNWDVVSDKMIALKEMWDLGLQAVCFLGNPGDQTNFPGLLTNANVTINTTVIPQLINSMSSTQYATFVANIIQTYFSNTNFTMMPDTFVIPYTDWNGLVTPVSAQFPNVSMLTYLLDAFRQVTGNPNFSIMPLAYCDTVNNTALIGHYRYALYHRDPRTLRMFVPVDFMLNPAGTANNWQFQGVAAGQFTSPVIIKPAEVLYFDHS
jgi:hypothetical protein